MKRYSITLTLLLTAAAAGAQTTYIPLGTEDYHLFDRLETRSGHLSPLLFNGVKPLPRKGAVSFLSGVQDNSEQEGMLTNSVDQAPGDNLSASTSVPLTPIDRYNVAHAISVSGEWASDENGALMSRRPFLKTFYKRQPDAVYVRTDNFFLSANPVISLQMLYEPDNASDKSLLSNSRGIELRGWIAKNVGFYTYLADNQEQFPSFVKDYVESRQAVIGADYYQRPNVQTYDYLMARGYVDFSAVKEHINVTFGYDKHFLGDGIRSLFLSDFSAPYAFLRLNTRIWKLNYQNLYMELTPQYQRAGDRELPHKYATMHHLSMNVTRWLNLGLFEGVIFNRNDHYEVGYLVPIIFYRQIERAQGSPDNALLGFNFKALVLRRLQFYGQFLLDEFKAKELTAGNGWWGNKFGVQAGAKYFDAFGVKNLDLQAEINAVRPFTYSHNDTVANYTHYNQPLAHPLGAGFAEVIGKVLFQPASNLYLRLQGMYYRKGIDNGANTSGFDIFRSNTDRAGEYGYDWVGDNHVSTTMINLNVSWEARENLFVDLGLTNRSAQATGAAANNTTYLNAGLRLNFARRDYNFY